MGYGDEYPVTAQGRIVGVILMTAGISVFGTLAGFLSNKLTAPRRMPAETIAPVQGKEQETTNEFREMLACQEEMYREIVTRLEKIERALEIEKGEEHERLP